MHKKTHCRVGFLSLITLVFFLFPNVSAEAECSLGLQGEVSKNIIEYIWNVSSKEESISSTYTINSSKDCLEPITFYRVPIVSQDIVELPVTKKSQNFDFSFAVPHPRTASTVASPAIGYHVEQTLVADACGFTETIYTPICAYWNNNESTWKTPERSLAACQAEDRRNAHVLGTKGDLTQVHQKKYTGSVSYQAKISDVKNVEVIIDPRYAEATQRDAKLPISPLDDLWVTIDAVFCPDPATFNMVAHLVTYDAVGKEVVVQHSRFVGIHDDALWTEVVASGSKEEVTKIIQERMKKSSFTFVAPFQLSRLAQTPDQFNALVDSMNAGRRVFVRVFAPHEQNDEIEKDIDFGFCAPLSGSGKHKMVAMRGASSQFSATDLVKKMNEYVNEGFKKIQPYRQYDELLSYYVDLKLHDDSDLIKLAVSNMSRQNIDNGFPKLIRGVSSCKNASVYGMHIQDTYLNDKWAGMATYSGEFLINAFYPSSTFSHAQVYLHETNHAFGKLNDEAVHGPRIFPFNLTNCSIDPRQSYLYKGKLYGETHFTGCVGELYVKDENDPGKILYRPSYSSLMNQDESGGQKKLNVVSCGFVMKALRGGSAKSHFDECSRLIIN